MEVWLRLYNVVALQAISAEALDGKTIHHALGLRPYQSRGKEKNEAGPSEEAAKLVSQWKWLIIDEISMISVQFLAELDHHLRSIMSQVRRMKSDDLGFDRPFGGLHALFVEIFINLILLQERQLHHSRVLSFRKRANMRQVQQRNTGSISFGVVVRVVYKVSPSSTNVFESKVRAMRGCYKCSNNFERVV